MSKKAWIMFIVMELGMVLFVSVLMRTVGWYTIDVALWRKIVVTMLIPVVSSPFVWLLVKEAKE